MQGTPALLISITPIWASLRGCKHARPVVGENLGREQKAKDHVDHHACSEADKGLRSHARELTEAGGEPDREEAEDEGPAAEVLDRGDEVRLNHLLILII